MQVTIDELMQRSNVGFGTSGARGLVSDMTDEVCYLYTLAFIQHLQQSGQIDIKKPIALAGDLRPSTSRIMAAIYSAIGHLGLQCIYCGTVATPVMAAYALHEGLAGIMVTGSHIPDDRNGIKFYKPAGEILKPDEEGMRAQIIDYDARLFENGKLVSPLALPSTNSAAEAYYIKRLLDFFPPQILSGLRVGLYQHSSVIRDTLGQLLSQLGAEVITLARSETFIPVDTEAVREEDIALARQWAREQKLDAIASTDGDGDRPMLANALGEWLRGDILGIFCSRYLNANIVVTPVSSNSAVEMCGEFQQVIRTRIGSPYVIAAMEAALTADPQSYVMGYEANGGFLQASAVVRDGRELSPLPTRDSSLVILATLALAQQQGKDLEQLQGSLPARFTYSDRIKGIPTKTTLAFMEQFVTGDESQDLRIANQILGPYLGQVIRMDHTDGLRMTLASGEIAHYRPSGNAPELRCYSEAASETAAIELNRKALSAVKELLPT